METFYSGADGEKKFSPNPRCEEPWNAMYFVLWAWTLWTLFTIYLTFTNWIAFSWVAICTITFILVSRYTDGLQQMEISLHHYLERNNKKKGSLVQELTPGTKSDEPTLESNGNTITISRAGAGDYKLD